MASTELVKQVLKHMQGNGSLDAYHLALAASPDPQTFNNCFVGTLSACMSSEVWAQAIARAKAMTESYVNGR